MKTTISIIKADIGSIGGHLCPSPRVLEVVRQVVRERHAGLLHDSFISSTGDDVAILMSHGRGPGAEEIHRLAWDAFLAGTEVARAEGLYGAGQDLLKDSFAGNVTGAGPAVAELQLDERPAEPLLFFAADKTDPDAYNLPLYLAFADPMNTPGLLLAPALGKGFRWVVMDVDHLDGDRVIELVTPEELYPLAALLRDPERFVVESIWSRATGEVLAPFEVGHFVGGGMRGSHNMPLMPVRQNATVSYFDGPPVVSCAAFSLHDGKLTGPVDAFDHPFWDRVRARVSDKAVEMRRQGFFGAAMLPRSELEYTGITELLDGLDRRFQVRRGPRGAG